jgi:uncharacterized protein
MTDTIAPEASPDTRLPARWTRVLFICVCSFLLWLLLFAPTLQHNAQVSPVGTRRTVALDILGPIAATSRGLQLSRIVSFTDSVTGRTGNRPGDGSRLASAHRTTAATTTTTLPDITHPSAARKLRVLIVGDSIGIDMGGPLQNDLSVTGVVQATLDAHESTGLTRPDYFNWPAELESDVQADQPEVVVIMMGANDAQDFLGPPDVPYSSPQWNTLYAARVAAFMQIAHSGGAKVVWVGMPSMKAPALSAEMSDIDAVDLQQAARQVPPVAYISTWKILGSKKGTYTAFITNASGQVVNVRTPDGIHLTPAGGEVLSQRVIAYLRHTLHIVLP